MDPLPPGFARTRAALHRVAAERVSPERERVMGRIDLRATPGGFGTPMFGTGRVVRVDGAEIVFEDAHGERRERLEGVDETAARWLGDYFALALDVLRALAADATDPTPPKLWPEHFDYAIEAGTVRANYGFSPGDEQHPEPYAYVGPWEARPSGPLWNAAGFPGAELPLADLLAGTDPLAWMRERLTALHEAGGGADGDE